MSAKKELVRIRRLRVEASRFPGMKQVGWGETVTYGWRHKDNGPMGRFGGGWRWKLGIEMGGKSLLICLIIGMLVIRWDKEKSK